MIQNFSDLVNITQSLHLESSNVINELSDINNIVLPENSPSAVIDSTNNYKTELENLQSKISTDTSIQPFEDKINEIISVVNSLSDTINSLTTRITTLESEVSNFKNIPNVSTTNSNVQVPVSTKSTTNVSNTSQNNNEAQSVSNKTSSTTSNVPSKNLTTTVNSSSKTLNIGNTTISVTPV